MFKGTYTALVTPLNADGSVDYAGLRTLVEEQIAGNVDGLVPVGTTGESPTLTVEEHNKVIAEVIQIAAGRVKIIAGTGGNSTAEALNLTRHAIAAGADATLQVTPYYNKPNPEGIYRHFATVADLGLPVVLYNVPGRTGREIPLPVVERLAKVPNIAAIKEAAGDVARVSAIKDFCDLDVFCGDDALTVPMISVGACGVISVASNLLPAEVAAMVNAALANDFATAAALHRRLYPLFRDLFIDANPIPIKAAMAMCGKGLEVYRLPLCEMPAPLKAKLRETLVRCGALK